MNGKHTRIWFILGLLIIVTVISSLCTSNDNSEDSKYSDYEPKSKQKDLQILYLGNNYLLPIPPQAAPANITELPGSNQTTFSHTLFDRKFNDKIEPELDLWINSGGVEGINLEFEIIFQAVEDNTLMPDKSFKALFNNYTTNTTTGIINIKIQFLKYTGKPFDIKTGPENWCQIALRIKRVDDKVDSKLLIYHGAKNKISSIKTPYDQTLSGYEYEKNKKKEDKATPGFTTGIGIITLGSLIMIFYLNTRTGNE